MTNTELNKLTLEELRELNKKVVTMIKLKRTIEGTLNSDNLKKGMNVRYKGTSDKLKGAELVVIK